MIKKFPWALRLWVGRRKEPILGYVPKNYEKNNSGSKGLKHIADISCYEMQSLVSMDNLRSK